MNIDREEIEQPRPPEDGSTRRTFLKQTAGLSVAVATPGLVLFSTACAKNEAPAKETSVAGPLVPDFDHSYIRWSLDTKLKPPKTVSKPLPMTLNRVRMPIEAIATLTESATGTKLRYVLGAECQAEQVWVKRDVWHDPAASMCMIAGDKHCVIEKHWARADFEATLHPPKLGAQPERQLVDPADAFASFKIDVAEVAAVELETTAAILKALNGPRTVIARTEYTADGYQIVLEYPVKTVNFSEREDYYQVDTGPILFFDKKPVDEKNDQKPGDKKPVDNKPLDNDATGSAALGDVSTPPILACRMAYVAHNAPDWAEFLVNVKTPVKDDLRVYHYSKSVRIEGLKNRLFEIV